MPGQEDLSGVHPTHQFKEGLEMSWSITAGGTKEETLKSLNEDAPRNIAHVTGVERTLADQALGLLRAAVEANSDVDKYTITVSASGSATYNNGVATMQSISLNVSQRYKE
jgi:hypothetical protein